MKKILLTLSLAAVILAGCNKEAGLRGGQGSMSINLTTEGEFTAPETKVDASDEVDVNTFAVTITNASGEQVNSWDSLKNVPGVIPMDPASYKITATSQGMKDVAWNQPIYTGSQDFKLEAGKVVNIDLACKLRNMKVSVKCTQNFMEEMNPDFTIKVSTAKGYLEFTKAVIDQGTAKAGFFTVSPLTVDIKGTRKIDNSPVSHYFTVSTVAERDHHVFTVDARETGEISVGGGITVDYTVNNKEVDVQVGDLVENPVEDDNTGAPTVKGASIAAGAVVDPAIGSISVNYSLPIALIENPNITLGDVPVTTSVSEKVLTISFGALAYETSYTLNIPAGAVINATDKSEAGAYSLAFSTKEKEKVVPITITSTGGIDSPAQYYEGQSPVTFVIDITSENPIASFPVEIQSTEFQQMISNLNEDPDNPTLTSNVNLADMTAAEQEFWGNMFSTSSAEIKGNTSVHFSIGQYICAMPVGTHPIQMTIIDDKGNQKVVTITFKIVPKEN